MKKFILAVDLGTSNTTIYTSAKQVIFDEPTCVAIDKTTKEVKEIGYLASKIAGKTPFNYDVSFPVRNGIVDDDVQVYKYLQRVLNSVKLDKAFKNFTIIFSCPSKCSKVNADALINIGKTLQAKEIYIEPQAKLAALGAGENVYSPNATLVCNIGAGITDIGVVSMGELVSSSSTFVASSTFDEAIRRYMIHKQHILISSMRAEYVKMRVGDVSPVQKNQLLDVVGRDTITSLPTKRTVSSNEMKSVIEPLVDFISLKITDVISLLQPDLASDLITNGLILTGGGSLLGGLSEYLSKQLSIPVRVSKDPINSVTNGMKVLVDKLMEENK